MIDQPTTSQGASGQPADPTSSQPAVPQSVSAAPQSAPEASQSASTVSQSAPVVLQPVPAGPQPTPVASQPVPAAQQPPQVATTQQVGKYKVEVIRDKCISAASCVAIAPNTFELDEEGIAKIINKQPADSDETKLLGAQSCPTAAIVVTDTETGEQVWPK